MGVRLRFGKGQFFSVDLIIAVIIIMITLLVILGANDQINTTIIQKELNNDMLMISSSVSSLLISTSGNPINWEELNDINSESVYALGLSNNVDGWNLDQAKVDKFVNLNSSYNELKNILGIRGPGYEFYVNISDYTNGFIIGIEPSNAENIVNIERFVLLEGVKAVLKLQVWNHE